MTSLPSNTTASVPQNQRVYVAVRARPKLAKMGEKHSVECVRKQNHNSNSSMVNQQVLLVQEHDEKVSLEFQKKYFFSFDYVFDQSATQYEIYHEAIVDLMDTVLSGHNATIFTYGQTGSGKTHTVLGNWNVSRKSKSVKVAEEHKQSVVTPDTGLFIRCLADLFKFKQKNQEHRTVDIQVSILEIYNSELRDLLKKGTTTGKKKKSTKKKSTKIQIQETGDDVNLIGLSKKKVETLHDALSLYKKAISKRAVAATQANPESSRSHALFFVDVFQQEKDDQTRFLKSKICVCDLGGSEKVKHSKVTGQQLEEAKSINSSLSALGTAVNQMYMGNPHIPYRDSKLTHVLKGSFTGSGKILLIANISPVHSNLQETISTLRFADRVKQMRVDPTDLFDNAAQKEQLQWLSVMKMNEMLLTEVRLAEMACQYNMQMEVSHLLDPKEQLEQYIDRRASEYAEELKRIEKEQRKDYLDQVEKLFSMKKVVYDAEWEEQYAQVKNDLQRVNTEHEVLDQTLNRSVQEKMEEVDEKKRTLSSLQERSKNLRKLIEEKTKHLQEKKTQKRELEVDIAELEGEQKEKLLGMERSWQLQREELQQLVSQAEYETILFNYVEQLRRIQKRYFHLYEEVLEKRRLNERSIEKIHHLEIVNMSRRILYDAINSVDFSAKSLEIKKRRKMENDVLDQILNTTYPYDRSGIVDQVLDYLFSGTKMTVIGSSHKARIQTVFLSQDQQSVCYHDPGTSKASAVSFSLSSVREVILGQFSKGFARSDAEDYYHSLSIVGAKRTLNLIASNTFDFEAWILGMEEIIDCRIRYGEPLKELGEHASLLTPEEREFCQSNHIPAQVFQNCKIFVERAQTRGKVFTPGQLRVVSKLDFYRSRMLHKILVREVT